MPHRTHKMVKRISNLRERALLEADQFHLHQPHERHSEVKEKLVNLIWEAFKPYIDNPDNAVMSLPAAQFAYLHDKYSQPTIIRVKKYLGIKSFRQFGVWHWKLPLYSPTVAEQRIHTRNLALLHKAKHQVELMQRPCAQTLVDVMSSLHWCEENDKVVMAMADMGYKSRASIVHSKSNLGIVSRKIDGTWLWVYPHQEVKDWLVEQLIDGMPRDIDKICEKGFNERKYKRILLYVTQIATPGIAYEVFEDVVCWKLYGEDPRVIPPGDPVVVSAVAAAREMGFDVIENELIDENDPADVEFPDGFFDEDIFRD